MKKLLSAVLALATAGFAWAGAWSDPVEATARDGTPLVTCRAKLSGEFLVVEVHAAEGWHVYAMDNEQRAKEALAGRMSLGVEQNTEIVVTGGLEQWGDWFQSEPTDFSQPEIRWYSYGFDGASLLATRVKRNGGTSAHVAVRAQACDSESCISVEADLELPVVDEADGDFTTDGLVRVRRI